MRQTNISTFMLVAITVSAIVNMRSAALMASNGWLTLSLSLAAAICFLIPSAYVCANLAIKCEHTGGVYEWVRYAFGDRWGFLAIWFEWINNVVGYPTALAAISGMCLLIFNNEMPSPFLFSGLMLLILWLTIIYNHWPLYFSGILNILGSISAMLIATIIIILGIVWLSLTPVNWSNLAAEHQAPLLNQVALFAGFIGAYSGMQITGFHKGDVADPKRQFMLAMPIATIVIMLMIFGTAILMALTVPHAKLNVITGIEQMIHLFFQHFNLPYLGMLFGSMVLITIITSFSAWIIGPARGFQVALQHSGTINIISSLNRYGMPSGLLVLQGIISSVLILLFSLLPSFKAAYFLLLAMTCQFTALMYILVFAAGLKLIAKTLLGKMLCVLGMLSCSIGFAVGVFMPSQLQSWSTFSYSSIVIVGDVVIILLGLLLIHQHKRITS